MWRDERPAGGAAGAWWTLRQLLLALRASLALRWSAVTSVGPSIVRDARHAGRALRHSPWYTGGVIIVLAIAMSMATVVFAVVDGVLVKPLPFDRSDELVLVRGSAAAKPQIDPIELAMADVGEFRRAVPEAVFTAVSSQTFVFLKIDEREYWSRDVDASFFDVIGMRPLLGGFTREDYEWEPSEAERYQPVLISHAWWNSKFAGDPSALGRRVTVSERATQKVGYVVRGVLTPGFVFPLDFGGGQPEAHVLTPASASWTRPGGEEWRRFQIVARVPATARDTAAPRLLRAAQARYRAPLSAESKDSQAHSEAQRVWLDRVELQPIRDHLGERSKPAFRAIAGAAIVLMALACISVAGLTAARGVDRERERAIRRALGASRIDLARSTVFEITMMVTVSALLAYWLARPLLGWTLGLLPASLTLLKTPAIDMRVFAAVVIIGGVSAVLVSIWPAFANARAPTIGPSRLSPTGGRLGARSRQVLVVAQTALGFVLLVAGGLTLASLARAWAADVGYRRDHLAIVHAFADSTRPDAKERVIAFRDATAKLPGVSRVAATTIQIFAGRPGGRVSTNWNRPDSTGPMENVTERRVDLDFFAVANLRVVDGRLPEPAAWTEDAAVAVISERAARAYWPEGSAVGRTLAWTRRGSAGTPLPRTVVAVVGDARYVAVDQEPVGDLYFPGAISKGTYGSFFMVATRDRAGQVLPSILATAGAQGLRVERAATMEDALFATIRHRLLPLWLFGGLSLVGLVVLAAGTIGLLATTTAQRSREIGIRLALGSSPARVMRLFVWEQGAAVAIGIAIGALAAALTVGALRGELYEVSPHHPGVWLAVTALLGAVALAGSWLPARLAGRVDPATILRTD